MKWIAQHHGDYTRKGCDLIRTLPISEKLFPEKTRSLSRDNSPIWLHFYLFIASGQVLKIRVLTRILMKMTDLTVYQ